MGFLVTDNFENEDHCLQGVSEVSPDKFLRKIFRFFSAQTNSLCPISVILHVLKIINWDFRNKKVTEKTQSFNNLQAVRAR